MNVIKDQSGVAHCLYSLYDIKAGTFAAPVVYGNDALAKRALTVAVSDTDTAVARFPDDFQLFCLGKFFPTTASGMMPIELLPKPLFICTASEVLPRSLKFVGENKDENS